MKRWLIGIGVWCAIAVVGNVIWPGFASFWGTATAWTLSIGGFIAIAVYAVLLGVRLVKKTMRPN
jgi:membrane associated rhomboid family serine protease